MKKKKSRKERESNVADATVKIYSYPKIVTRKIETFTSHTSHYKLYDQSAF